MSSCESSEILDESVKSEEDPMPAENEPEEEQEQEEEPGDDNGEQADDGRREPDDRLKQLEGVAGDQQKQETLRADEELLAKDAARDDARQSSYLRKCAGAGGCDADAKEDRVEDAEVESPHDVTATASVETTDEKQGGGGGRGGGGHESTRTQADEEEDERKGDGVDNDAPCTKDGGKIKSEEKTPSEDGERNGEGGGFGGGIGGREVGVEVGGVKKGDATITKKYLKAARALESSSQPASSSTDVTPKKTAQKVNSIIEGYVTKVSGGGGGADRASPQGKRAVRRSETESSRRGNISEIRERMERSASSAAQSPRKAGGKGEEAAAEAAGTNDGSALEERRRKKAEEWMNKITKVTKSSVDNGVQHSPASVNQTALTSPTGKGSTSSAWKRKEEELKREKEQREAAQKQLEEKRKKLEEERRLARESSKKRNDPDRTDSAKKDLTLHGQKSTTTSTRTTKTTTTTTTTTTATPDTKNSSHSTRLLSSANEDEEKMKKKQKVLESRVQPLSTEGLDAEGLEKMVNEMYKRIIILEEEKYDMETLLEKRENELHEIKVRMGESKGKFVKPQLKKVIKREEA